MLHKTDELLHQTTFLRKLNNPMTVYNQLFSQKDQCPQSIMLSLSAAKFTMTENQIIIGQDYIMHWTISMYINGYSC